MGNFKNGAFKIGDSKIELPNWEFKIGTLESENSEFEPSNWKFKMHIVHENCKRIMKMKNLNFNLNYSLSRVELSSPRLRATTRSSESTSEVNVSVNSVYLSRWQQ